MAIEVRIPTILRTYTDGQKAVQGSGETIAELFADLESRHPGIQERLVEGGDTVVVIEHNLDVIKTADYIIDLGPEGGDRGGMVVAQGTPEEIAACPLSYTGKFLAPVLEKGKKAKGKAG